MPSFASVSSLLLLALPFTACASNEDWTTVDYGVSAVQFLDMVVPSDMHIVDEYHESHSRETAGWRYGSYDFRGRTPIAEASAYLLRRMPEHNWQLIGEEKPGQDTHKLQFARGQYRAEYTLQRVDGRTRMHVDYRTELK